VLTRGIAHRFAVGHGHGRTNSQGISKDAQTGACDRSGISSEMVVKAVVRRFGMNQETS
jgi:hypothetical protein